jgi:hypothetical protein
MAYYGIVEPDWLIIVVLFGMVIVFRLLAFWCLRWRLRLLLLSLRTDCAGAVSETDYAESTGARGSLRRDRKRVSAGMLAS